MLRAGDGDLGNSITASEAEMYVQQLRAFELRDVASPEWMRQHEYIEKLNIQAHINAATQTDEFVKEALISFSKIPILVHELVLIGVWREKVYPLLKEMDFAAKSTITPYMTIYHEMTVISLLEAVLYHREACESAGDTIMDLADYAYQSVASLLQSDQRSKSSSKKGKKGAADYVNMSGQQQLDEQTETLPFDISTKAVSILRYISDHITHLPLSCMTRLLNTHDAPQMLCALVEHKPWTRFESGVFEKYIDGAWTAVKPEDRLALSKTEAQVWLTLYNLLMEVECRRKYRFDTHNRGEILKLRAHFNDVMSDQLPMLRDLRRMLEELSMMTPPEPEAQVLLEQLPEIRDTLLRINGKKWQQIAEYQMKNAFAQDDATLRAQAQRLAQTYNFDGLEALFPTAPKCAVCGEASVNRCSRCQSEWYCRRQCQVEDWSRHKQICNTICAQGKAAASQQPGAQAEQIVS
eukprot:m.97285 g.97285  ORF g.97285 m.97285 type:complete len:466 (+) comp15523_c0_seq2:65-1462(+)